MTSSLAKKHKRVEEWKDNNPKRTWIGSATRDARRRAVKKGVPYNLTIDYVMGIAADSCPIFNTPFVWRGNKQVGEKSPTLDRIVPALGYVIGNVVVISSKANNIKSAYIATDIFTVAEWLQTIEDQR